MGERRLVVELIKRSHYHDDSYVIQRMRSLTSSNSLACLYALARDVAARPVPISVVFEPTNAGPASGKPIGRR
jgi:hypothetical protein